MLLEPAPVKRQVLIRLPDPVNAQARELAILRRQPLGPLLQQLLAKVVPQALREERERLAAQAGLAPDRPPDDPPPSSQTGAEGAPGA